MEQVFQSRINSRLAVLYEHMLYRDISTFPCELLPAVLNVPHRVPQPQHEVCGGVPRGTDWRMPISFRTVQPMFPVSERNVLVFQDSFGSRYMDVRYVKTRVMNRPDLESRCFEVYPEHPMLLLMKVRKILDGSIGGEEDIAVLEQALDQEELNPLYRRLILDRVIAYYDRLDQAPDEAERGLGYLLRMDKGTMTKGERTCTAGVFIKRGYYGEAWDIVCRYGWEGLDEVLLETLCSRTILQNLFDENEKLLDMAETVFLAGKADGVILDYLCEALQWDDGDHVPDPGSGDGGQGGDLRPGRSSCWPRCCSALP